MIPSSCGEKYSRVRNRDCKRSTFHERDSRRFFPARERRREIPQRRSPDAARTECAASARLHVHTCRPTRATATTSRTKILAICAATAATLRRMHVGGGGNGELRTGKECRRRCRVAPPSIIHFHYIFAIGALFARDALYLTSNRMPHQPAVAKCLFLFFFLSFLSPYFPAIFISVRDHL